MTKPRMYRRKPADMEAVQVCQRMAEQDLQAIQDWAEEYGVGVRFERYGPREINRDVAGGSLVMMEGGFVDRGCLRAGDWIVRRLSDNVFTVISDSDFSVSYEETP